MKTNSKEYWEERFSNGDWEIYDGDLQSAFFSELFVREAPEWLRADLNRNLWDVADYGCAKGGGSAVLSKAFPTCKVTGYDFSEAAIADAANKHPGCSFKVADLLGEIPDSDVIFSSNTLEHMREPFVLIRRMIGAARKHAIFMLPFEDEYGYEEHISVFTAGVFADSCGDHYLSLFKVIDCREKNIPYWPGKQLMVVYTNRNFREPSDYRVAEQYELCCKGFVEELYQKRLDEKKLQDQLAQKQADLDNTYSQKLTAEQTAQTLRGELAQKQAELDDTYSQKLSAEQTAQALQGELNRKQDALAQKEAQLQDALAQKDAQLQDALAQKEAQLQDALAQKDAQLQDALARKDAQLRDALARKDAQEQDILAQKEAELCGLLAQKQAADQQTQELRAELDRVLAQRQEVEVRLASANLILQQYQQNRVLNGYAVNNLISECTQLLSRKAFKLMHLLVRIRNQLLKGPGEERKKFWKWLFSRSKKRPDNDHRFKPLYGVIQQLIQIQGSLFYELPGCVELPEYDQTAAPAPCVPAEQPAVEELQQMITLPSSVTGTPAKCLEQTYDKPDVIMFSVINYDFRFQRPQHFAKRFAQNGHRVFYINANFVNPERTQEIEPGLFTVDFMTTECNAIYFNDAWAGFEDWLREKMEALIHTYAIRDAIVVLDYPNWIACAEYLRDTYGFKMVADYMDDATGFLGTTTDTLKDNCLRMLRDCDLTVPSSQFLYDIAKEYSDKLTIVRNGTEVDHFYQALAMETKRERPVIGYYGAVSHWFAWDKVCYLAKHLPQCDIVIIGSVTEYADKLSRYSNIKLLGEMDYRNLPEHLAYFDVCLIPFDTSTDLIKATNPVKFYEYLSAGKRIVATEIPELEPFRDRYVYMSNDNKQFLEYVKLCLDGEDTLASREDCIAFAKENDWQHRYEAFAAACEQAVPKVSVIVLTYNNLKLNRYCIESILEKTAYPNYELLVVDNLSTDGTVEYLKELEKQNHPRLKIIFNQENSGFAGGNNKAIALSDAKYVVLLNNDTVVTRGWLTAMVKHMEKDPKCGMVGAVTNSIGNEAMIAAVYRNLKELARFAYAYTQTHNNEVYREIDRLALFCTMIRKDILDRHGMLDDGYKVGMFEDDDFAMLVKKAGYHYYAVEDCFIHHVNNASFKKLQSEEYQKIFDANKARFEKKWNTTWAMPNYRAGVTWNTNLNTMIEPVE